MPGTRFTEAEVTGLFTPLGGIKPAGVALSANGAIAVPAGSTNYVITKAGSLAALTLADPTAVTHDYVELVIVSAAAFAHTITNAGSGFNSGGAASDVATFTTALGNNMRLMAYNGKWYVLSSVGVTLA